MASTNVQFRTCFLFRFVIWDVTFNRLTQLQLPLWVSRAYYRYFFQQKEDFQ